MILADKIINERKKLGLSQEELAEKLNVSRQAVSKWESTQSTPDLQRVIQLAAIFGVSTDYLLKDDMDIAEYSNNIDYPAEDRLPVISMEEANEFMAQRERSSRSVSLGVALCILSPVLLVFLAGLSESGMWNISEALASGVGMIALFGLIAAAVYIFIVRSKADSKYEWMETERFETAYGVSGLVKEKLSAFEQAHTKGLAGGIVLCVLASLPLIVAGCTGCAEYIYVILTALLLVLVALGVYLIVRVSIVRESYEILLQQGEFNTKDKQANKRLAPLNGIYWSLATAVYLGYSFYTGAWDRTWIVWPVAAVLFAVVMGIAKVFITRKD